MQALATEEELVPEEASRPQGAPGVFCLLQAQTPGGSPGR